jgi:hypothetical protein
VSEMTQEQAPARNSRKGLQIALLAGVVVAGLALAAVAFLGGSDPAVPAAAPEGTDPSASDADDAPPAVVDVSDVDLAALPTVTYDVFLARDPFDPVIPEAVAAAGDTVQTQPSMEPDLAQPVDTETTDDGTQSGRDDFGAAPVDGTDPTDACRGDGGEEVVCNGHVVSLQSLTNGAEPLAVIQVDTVVYGVVPGQVFAERFQFLDVVDDRTVRLLYGDEVFRVSVGERVMK